MRVDSHQHFWRIADRQGHWPPSSLAAIHRDFEPDDLLPLLQRCGIDGTVLVQSLPTPADTAFMLELAARHDFILGVVGWADLKAEDAVVRIGQLSRHAKLKGLRPMLQELADDHWIDDPALDPAAGAMIAHALSFDALVLPRQLTALLAFARRHPRLAIVIDHAAKPDIAHHAWQPWQADIAALADLPNVECKLSGLLAEAGMSAGVDSLQPYVDHIFTCFGSARVMWGSDWPVLRLAQDYAEWFVMAQRLCLLQPGMTGEVLASVFGGNARRFYRLD